MTAEAGPVGVEVPRGREGLFEPQIVKERQRRLSGVGEMVLSLSARGLAHGEISAHLAGVCGAGVSRATVSTVIGKVIDGMREWQGSGWDWVCPVLFIDCVRVKPRDGEAADRPVCVVLAVTVEGTGGILGLRAGGGGEGAKYWLRVLTEIRNRGTGDICMVVCGGLRALPGVIAAVWPQAITQTWAVHLTRASFRYAARQDWDRTARARKPIRTAATQDIAGERFLELRDA
ncbi:Transposase, Mutator family (plasmid) [Streptomyces sp. YIM 121038]|nr:Transposase, Mutator family [Streptomyces sp. YIM 121038]